MCSRQLGAAAASILLQNLELQEIFLERYKQTESEKDNERYDRPRPRPRERESEKDKER